jgi:hypothetical protein
MTTEKLEVLLELVAEETYAVIQREGLFSELQLAPEVAQARQLANISSEVTHLITARHSLAFMRSLATSSITNKDEEALRDSMNAAASSDAMSIDSEFLAGLETLLTGTEIEILRQLLTGAAKHTLTLETAKALLPALNPEKYLLLLGDGPLIQWWVEKSPNNGHYDLIEGKVKRCRTDHFRYPALRVLPENSLIVIDRAKVLTYEKQWTATLDEIIYSQALECDDPTGVNFYQITI